MEFFACHLKEFSNISLRVVLIVTLQLVFIAVPSFAYAISTVTLTLNDGEATEFGQDPANFTFARTDDGNIAATLRVHVTVLGSATISSDYGLAGVGFVGGDVYYVDIIGGQLSRTITLVPVLDNLIEGEEDVLLALQDLNASYVLGEEIEARITIADDVTNVTLALDDGDMREFGQNPGSFTLTRSENGNVGVGGNIRVHVIVLGSATIGSDYNLPGVGFVGGDVYYVDIFEHQLSRTITLVPVLDNLIEGQEALSVQLQDIGAAYTATIENTVDFTLADDVTNVTLALNDGDMRELGQNPGSFTLTRGENGYIAGTVRVHVIFLGSATIGSDYNLPGVGFVGGDAYYVDIHGGQLTRTITLVPVLDDLIEGEETISVQLKDIGVAYTATNENTVVLTIADYVEIVFKDSFEEIEP